MTPRRREPMLTNLYRRLNYANVVATLALFIALGGSSYAVTKISGSQIRNNSVAGKKLKRNTLGGKRIKESRLGTVPSARNAATVGGLSAEQLLVRCPQGTMGVADVCVETQPRPPAIYTGARTQCGSTDGPPRAGGCPPTVSWLGHSPLTRSSWRRGASSPPRSTPPVPAQVRSTCST